ncbi:RNA polymerase sigma factor [Thalassotalea agarivorans]|uniref:RNA polymerase sigma-70 factor, ECF subfamily n=1 Tax=Thalassotalea agarivorans TaxID=349064 RepID=A0A1I0H3X1_THASX|nr:RNA polymerase sigma factor [Thalassotalea agarivorans]SET77517.1 RNA polymerase sigma-70 factor, ECF subfamily [Thalassotalea agarivorans]
MVQPLSNENELIAKVLATQCENAFAQLITHYQQSLRQYCRRLCSNDFSLADDVAQNTFIQVYQKLSMFQGKGKFQGWLFRIAYFEFLQLLRKQKPVDELSGNEEASDNVSQMTEKRDLEWAVAQLSAVQRACITLQFNFGYNQEEISAMLDLPVGTVKSHVRRGKEILTQLLNPSTQNNRGVA